MKRVLAVFLIAVVALVGVLLAAPGFIDWSQHKETIVSQLHQRTGLDFEMAGDVELSVIPYPRVIVENLTVRNPEYNDATLLTLDRLDVAIAVKPLFSGLVTVDSLSLVKPSITLETGPEGRRSWMTEELSDGTEAGDPEGDGRGPEKGGFNLAEAVSLDSINIKDGLFSYTDKAAGQSYELSDIDMTLKAETIKGPFALDGDFLYMTRPVKMTAEIGRIEQEAPISVDVNVDMPQSGANIRYSGIVDMTAGTEIQGQTTLESDNLRKTLQLAGIDTPAALSKSFSATGLLTAGPRSVAYQDAKISLAGQTVSGHFSLSDLNAADKAPLLEVEVTAAPPFDLSAILSQDKTGGRKDEGQEGKKLEEIERLLPESVTLPMALRTDISLNAPSVRYDDNTISNLSVTSSFADRAGDIAVQATLPGSAVFDLSGTLSFGSKSRSQAEGAVTYSEPTFEYSLSLSTEQGPRTMSFFLPGEGHRQLVSAAQGKVSAKASGALTGRKISVTDGSLTIQPLQASLTASYELRDPRDKASLSMQTESLDLDLWIDRFSEPENNTPRAEAKTAAAVIKDATRSLVLPFDLDLNILASDTVFKTVVFDTLALKGAVKGDSLTLNTLDLKQDDGHKILAGAVIDDLRNLSGIQINTQIKTPNANELLEAFMAEPPVLPEPLIAMDVISEFTGSIDKLAFTSNISAAQGKLETSGTITDVISTASLSDLVFRLRHPSYVDIVQIFDPGYRSKVAIKKSVDIYTEMKRQEGVYRFSGLNAVIGPTTLTGGLSFDNSGTLPYVTADLSADTLPVDKLIGFDAGHKGTVRAQPLRQRTETRWSRNAINTTWMHDFNADIKLSAQDFSYGPWQISSASLAAGLNDGVLTLDPVSGNIHGGSATLTAKVASTGQDRVPLEISGNASLKGISLEQFVRSFSGERLVTATGTIDFSTDLQSRGMSPAALIYGLNGSGQASGSDLVFKGFDLPRLSALLANPSSSMTENLNTLLSTTMQGGSTTFDTMDAAYSVTEGVIDFTKLQLEGPEAVVKGDGTVNLPLWTIDMTTTIFLRKPADAPELKISFSGPLDKPARTFGKGPMQSYFENIIGSEFKKMLRGELEESGIIRKPAEQIQQGGTGQTNTTGTTGPATETGTATQDGQEAPAQEQQPREIKPEDALRGILEGVLGGR